MRNRERILFISINDFPCVVVRMEPSLLFYWDLEGLHIPDVHVFGTKSKNTSSQLSVHSLRNLENANVLIFALRKSLMHGNFKDFMTRGGWECSVFLPSLSTFT